MAPALSVLRPYAFAVGLAAASALVAVAVSAAFGLPLRDPDGIAGPSYVRLPGIVVLLFLADTVPRALRQHRPVRAVVRERWTAERAARVLVGLASFYATYVAYRNLKGALPFARPRLLDGDLLALDRAMAFGRDPATLLHEALGTGVAAHVLSAVYLAFLVFVPLSLGVALVWGRNVRVGSWYVTALCVNWLLGAASYYLVPSMGPVFIRPSEYADLPETGVTVLQEGLIRSRLEALADPVAADTISGIAGFASLHCSIVFTAALVAHLVGLRRAVRWSLWAFLGLTVVATAYFGWHYLIDDVAGLAIGALAVLIGWRVTQEASREPAPPVLREPTPA